MSSNKTSTLNKTIEDRSNKEVLIKTKTEGKNSLIRIIIMISGKKGILIFRINKLCLHMKWWTKILSKVRINKTITSLDNKIIKLINNHLQQNIRIRIYKWTSILMQKRIKINQNHNKIKRTSKINFWWIKEDLKNKTLKNLATTLMMILKKKKFKILRLNLESSLILTKNLFMEDLMLNNKEILKINKIH